MTGETTWISTGIDGLDEIIGGGLLPTRSYMIEGPAGAGKSLLGLQYLVAGTNNGESALYVNLEETTDSIRTNAADIEFLDFSHAHHAWVCSCRRRSGDSGK